MSKIVSLGLALLLVAALGLGSDAQAAPTTLVAGDIAIVGFNFDDNDQLAFVLLRDIEAGTQISFTDNGWTSTNTFRTGEGTFTWSAPTSLAAGTVVTPALSGVALSVDGDQILAYQGSTTAPVFLYALNSEGAGVWQSSATTSNTSALPAGLTNGTTAVALNEIDNARYIGTTGGTRAQLLTAISNRANWSGSDTTRQTMPTGPFNVGGATPTPTSTPAPPTPTPTPTVPACPMATVTAIGAIQGTGASSPRSGQSATIRGVVTADFQGTGELSGFFVQDSGDGNSASSDGIFVASTIAVSAGDAVQVTGTVAESGSRTQISTVQSATVCGTAPTITPINLSLPVAATADLEKYEGMRVTFPQMLYVIETYTLGRYGEVDLASERLWTPTNVTTPGSAANALQAQNDLKRITLDDGSTAQNPDPIEHPAPGLTAANTLRSGDTVAGLTGVIDYANSKYRVQPTVQPSWVRANQRAASPSVTGSLRVASFNVLNYFNGPTFPTSRGASSTTEFTRQRDKTISAILAMRADIIGLIELENDGYGTGSAIQDLLNGLNSRAPAGTSYAFINPGVSQIGTDEITVGLIYRVETVQPVGAAKIKTDGAFATLNRPPLAQTFRQIATGGKLTIAVNHFKSKGSACTGDPDTGDGQGNCNQTRVNAANALTSWLATDPTASGDADFLIVGDLNAYAKEDPITAIKSTGYTNLIEQYLGQNAYSYVFAGQAGYLDHALATSSLTAQVVAATEWHINADEPIVLDYNTEFKTSGQISSLYSADPYRSSDHDPVVVGLTLNP